MELGTGAAADQVQHLLDRCAGMPDGTVVVVDELHLLQDDALVAELVQLVLGAPGLHLVLASRSVVPMPLGLLTAHGRVDVLDEVDLAFDETDLRGLVELMQVPASDEDVSRAVAFSGGWAGPLRIMAEHGRTRRLRAIETALHSYVDSEVLDQLPRGDRRLLRDAAVLPSLDAASVAAVTERSDAMARLDHLHARGVPMHWPTNHEVVLNPVLRHRLLQRLRLDDAATARVLNRRPRTGCVRTVACWRPSGCCWTSRTTPRRPTCWPRSSCTWSPGTPRRCRPCSTSCPRGATGRPR